MIYDGRNFVSKSYFTYLLHTHWLENCKGYFTEIALLNVRVCRQHQQGAKAKLENGLDLGIVDDHPIILFHNSSESYFHMFTWLKEEKISLRFTTGKGLK